MTRKDCINILIKSAPAFAKKVAPIYKLLHWTWAETNGNRVPTESKILATLVRIITELDLKKHNWEISTGGLLVGFTQLSKDCYQPIMKFELEYLGD